MAFTITRNHQIKAMLLLWGYDLAKFWLFCDLARTHNINPYLFLFLDMATVPLYILSLSQFVNSMTRRKAMNIKAVFIWGGILLVNTILPYAYAAWAGKASFSSRAWLVFGLVVAVILANLLVSIRAKLARTKVKPSDPAAGLKSKTRPAPLPGTGEALRMRPGIRPGHKCCRLKPPTG